MRINTDFREFDNFTKELKKQASGKALEKQIKRALAKIGILVRRDVVKRTPRDTGDLMNSWKVESDKLTIEIGYDIIYALYQHQGMRQDGTHVIVNRPAGGETYFLKNAVNASIPKIKKMFNDALAESLTE